MSCIIIAMPRIDEGNKLSMMLGRHGYNADLVCTSAADVLSESSRRDYGVVICGGRLKDMSYAEIKDCLPLTFELVILTKDIGSDEYPYDTIKLLMPFQVRDLIGTIETVFSRYYRKRKVHESSGKNRSGTDKLEIEKAKAILMDRNGMTEPEAHRYIQKNSMDTSRTMAEVAAMIILLNNER